MTAMRAGNFGQNRIAELDSFTTQGWKRTTRGVYLMAETTYALYTTRR